MYSTSLRTGPRVDRALLRSIQKCFSARFNHQLTDMQLVIWARMSCLPDLITAFDITSQWKDRKKLRAISLDEIIRYASKVIITNAQARNVLDQIERDEESDEYTGGAE
jgi:hypothetical protein